MNLNIDYIMIFTIILFVYVPKNQTTYKNFKSYDVEPMKESQYSSGKGKVCFPQPMN